MEPDLSIAQSLKVAFLSAFAGCFLSTIIFCCGILATADGMFSLKGIIAVQMWGALVGTMALLFSIPAALILGTPLHCILTLQVAANPKSYAVLFALIGAAVGWIIFLVMFSDGLGSTIEMAKYACPLYGAGVAGIMPLTAAWLNKSIDLP
ncbi:hypothetical protein [Sphingobium aromaticivastans]|uniref:hypothetical protein n=1 Tax=Sphingobium aromaticivastans TaxID=1778665 RepID=UPI003019C2A0